jgi:hypothetical protein
MERLTLDKWTDYETSHMFSNGASHQDIVGKILGEIFPGYTFRLANEEKIDRHRFNGYALLREEHIEAELKALSRRIPERFLLKPTADGNVKFKEQWVMIRPKELTETKISLMNKKSEEIFNKTVQSPSNIGPSDMQSSIQEGLTEIRKPTETEVVRTVKKK